MKGNEDLARSVMPVSSDLSGFSREHMVANPELLVIVSRAFIVACVGMAVYIWKRKRSGLKLDSRWRLVGPLGLFTLVVSLDTYTVHNDEPKVQLTLISVGLALLAAMSLSTWLDSIRLRRRIERDLGRKATDGDLTSINTWIDALEAEKKNAEKSPRT
jgi:hypothetical protein